MQVLLRELRAKRFEVGIADTLDRVSPYQDDVVAIYKRNQHAQGHAS